jgi:peroxiredoxin family protein
MDAPTHCIATETEINPIPLPESFHQLSERLEQLERQFEGQSKPVPGSTTEQEASNRLNLLVFSGELDRLLAAFVLATGAAACGMKVTMFFSFWATAALKKAGPQASNKSLVERMFGWMLPGGYGRRKLSHLDMLGAGRWMMCREMARKNIASLPELISVAEELGVEISICDMSMSLMGIRDEELIDYRNRSRCGAARFLELASESRTTLFI